jgi:hypothetical protein
MTTRPPARTVWRLFAATSLLAAWTWTSAWAGTCQEARGPAGDWRFGASDSQRGWSRAEWVELDEVIQSIVVRGTALSRFQGIWAPCLDPQLSLELTIRRDEAGRPGAELHRQVFQMVLPTEGALYGGVATAVQLDLPVDPALDLHSGWVGVRSLDSSGCFWLWAAADGGDGVSALERGAVSGSGWEVAPFDLAVCVQGRWLDAPKIQVRRVGESMLLSWKPVDQAGRYQVWMSRGDGLGFQPAGDPITQTVWSRPLDSLAAVSSFRVTSLEP